MLIQQLQRWIAVVGRNAAASWKNIWSLSSNSAKVEEDILKLQGVLQMTLVLDHEDSQKRMELPWYRDSSSCCRSSLESSTALGLWEKQSLHSCQTCSSYKSLLVRVSISVTGLAMFWLNNMVQTLQVSVQIQLPAYSIPCILIDCIPLSPCPSLNSWVYSNSCPLSLKELSTHLCSPRPLSPSCSLNLPTSGLSNILSLSVQSRESLSERGYSGPACGKSVVMIPKNSWGKPFYLEPIHCFLHFPPDFRACGRMTTVVWYRIRLLHPAEGKHSNTT